jgi:cation:H+ antiporter
MSVPIAVLLFCGSLLLTLISSIVLSERLDQVGHRFCFPPGLIGLVTALGADSPEIASAVSAIFSGQHELGRGVIFGSGIFNIAMLIGFSALIVGGVSISPATLALNGGAALILTLIVGAQTVGWIGSMAAGLLLAAVLVPYLILSSLRRDTVRSLKLPEPARKLIERATVAETRENEADEATLQRMRRPSYSGNVGTFRHSSWGRLS